MIKMPMGKFAGVPIQKLPTNYIAHAIENFTMEDDLKSALKKELLFRLNLFPVYSMMEAIYDGNIERMKYIIAEYNDYE